MDFFPPEYWQQTLNKWSVWASWGHALRVFKCRLNSTNGIGLQIIISCYTGHVIKYLGCNCPNFYDTKIPSTLSVGGPVFWFAWGAQCVQIRVLVSKWELPDRNTWIEMMSLEAVKIWAPFTGKKYSFKHITSVLGEYIYMKHLVVYQKIWVSWMDIWAPDDCWAPSQYKDRLISVWRFLC